MRPQRATAAQLVRRVNFIERQRDQSESEAVSGARTSQRPVACLLVVAAVDPPSEPNAEQASSVDEASTPRRSNARAGRLLRRPPLASEG
jgi:hypothetical protein